jgi:hypothetical protein
LFEQWRNRLIEFSHTKEFLVTESSYDPALCDLHSGLGFSFVVSHRMQVVWRSTAGRFRIIHPFHPLHGVEYELVSRKLTWGEDRIFYYAPSGKLKSMLTNVTDVVPIDAFDRLSAGRSAFRVDDLLELRRLFAKHQQAGKGAQSV